MSASTSGFQYDKVVSYAITKFFDDHGYSDNVLKGIFECLAMDNSEKLKDFDSEKKIVSYLQKYFLEFFKKTEKEIADGFICYFFKKNNFKDEILREILKRKFLEYYRLLDVPVEEINFSNLYQDLCRFVNSKEVNKDELFDVINDRYKHIEQYLRSRFPEIQYCDIKNTIQDTLVKYFGSNFISEKYLHEVKTVDGLSACLRRIATNTYIDKIRAECAAKRGGKNKQISSQTDIYIKSKKKLLYKEDVLSMLKKHLSSHELQVAIKIIDDRFYDEQTWDTIAENLEKSVPTIKKIYKKIRKILKKEIENE